MRMVHMPRVWWERLVLSISIARLLLGPIIWEEKCRLLTKVDSRIIGHDSQLGACISFLGMFLKLSARVVR